MSRTLHILAATAFCLFVFPQTPTQTKLIDWQAKPRGSNNERSTEGTQVFRVLERVEIVDVAIEKPTTKPVTIGEAFSADDDWLQSLVMRVRNISGQQLTAIQLTLVLPQMGPGSPDVVYCYGCAPEQSPKESQPAKLWS